MIYSKKLHKDLAWKVFVHCLDIMISIIGPENEGASNMDLIKDQFLETYPLS